MTHPKQPKGITLIALVVTIIVLLILEAITIRLAISEDGIIGRTREARTAQDIASLKEQAELVKLSETASKRAVSETLSAENLAIAIANDDAFTESTRNGKIVTTADGKYDVVVGNDLSITVIAHDGTTPPPSSIPNDIFVALYNDGTLVFSNNLESIDSSKVSQNYGNIKDEHYAGEIHSVADPNLPEWSCDSSIKNVIILNEIVPKYTSSWFADLEELENIEGLNYLDTSNVTDMSYMFSFCWQLTELDLHNFDTEKVTNMASMFNGCNNLRIIDVSSFDTSNVTDMSWMFALHSGFSCDYRKTIIVGSGWNTNSVTNSEFIFANNINLCGECGTYYNGLAAEEEISYAHVDSFDNPGYLTMLSGDYGYLWNQYVGKETDEIADYNEVTDEYIFKNSELELVYVESKDDYYVKYKNNYYIFYDLYDGQINQILRPDYNG